jgi:hypothetical protein
LIVHLRHHATLDSNRHTVRARRQLRRVDVALGTSGEAAAREQRERHRASDSVSVVDDLRKHQVYAQRPDAVVFGLDTYARTLTRVAGTLPSFVSPTAWCSGTTLQGVTLQAY